MNSSIEVYLQIGTLGDVKLRNMASLFAQIFSEPFFDLLRTKEQLGYVVRHQTKETGSSIGLRFFVQSEKSPIYLDARIEVFLTGALAMLAALSDVDLAEHAQSLVDKLLAKHRKLSDETRRYWTQIQAHQYHFSRNADDAEMILKLTRTDLEGFIQQHGYADHESEVGRWG